LSVSGSDQAGCPIAAGLSQKQGRFSVLNRCFWRQKERFKQSSGKGLKNGEGMTVLEGYFLIGVSGFFFKSCILPLHSFEALENILQPSMAKNIRPFYKGRISAYLYMVIIPWNTRRDFA
jgi:hypothetical protein